MSGDIIPRESLLDVFGTASGLGIKSITVTGDGEPTLNPTMYEALTLGKAQGLDIGFATNGIALSINKSKVILDSCVWVRFNLSAVSQRGYQTIHGVNEWDRVKQNIEQMVQLKGINKNNTTIGFQMVLTPEALDEVIPEAKLAVALGVDYFVIKQFSDPECEAMSRFSLDWYDNPEVLKVLKEVEQLSNDTTKIVPKWDMIHSKGIRQYDRCVDCALLFQISGSSKCYPCGYLFGDERYCYGDLKKQTLQEILESERYWAVVKEMRDNFNVHTQCKGCCRHDFSNKFIWDYLREPQHLNFI
jgi:molybdenum cofactor biosynthesis enzyme MoaA